jgi:F-type H+-transporting ATPase subunit b
MLALLTLVLQEHGGTEGPSGPFSLEPGLVIWTWIVFIALFFVLKRFAWPIILRATEERERRIKMQLEEAEKRNAEARALLEEHKKLMAGAKDQAHSLLAEAKAVAERERETLLAKARQEQEQMLQRAKQEIEAERERAINELRREAVDLSLAAASKLIEARLDSEADRRIVTEFLKSAGKGR